MFLRSNKFKLEKILGFRNMQEKLENSLDLNYVKKNLWEQPFFSIFIEMEKNALVAPNIQDFFVFNQVNCMLVIQIWEKCSCQMAKGLILKQELLLIPGYIILAK